MRKGIKVLVLLATMLLLTMTAVSAVGWHCHTYSMPIGVMVDESDCWGDCGAHTPLPGWGYSANLIVNFYGSLVITGCQCCHGPFAQ